ncbi:2-phospho-L-lactate guanylyltransferase [Rhodoplanes sp. TEM]|uniref:3-phospho-D-glycerate guanylyltransferase n=1 Tax=Rhodoplanes tepidamans TaxID=200616 RepID=A0ABT5JIW4_RHOTP|nr:MULTISPECIES: 2-phospho-L-lactate guanylyltransferase [Rhodoplanes]MDC7789676.1 2-phospho-L-lactate guanylyltransferase [Rhodoplanes tepidamans]MDC7983847.1 2-phospho-L-lactate guanylyltransferase [Rhodoplanes sp. TEM]MDQ0359144.1 2-phospho-L-lactate guanylyltransferase [Rhodoplanes tepidamans]
MTATRLCAVVPIKGVVGAKQRLSAVLPAETRSALAMAMAEDVLEVLAQVPELARVLVVTADATAAALARRYGAEVTDAHAGEGHTGAVTGAARRLVAEGFGMITLPGDLPLLVPADVRRVMAAHRAAPAFTIAPARDLQGSNAIVCSPADAVPLRFGPDSFYPHLDAARRQGIEPTVVEVPGFGFDIDEPHDLAAFVARGAQTRAGRLVADLGPELSARLAAMVEREAPLMEVRR